MSFLQPWLLFALPLASLPVIIHLINQRRYQTAPWAAMMFLLAANRMSRGYARLRQWLILLARVLAIAGLIFAISRPLASGWLGLAAGGRPDTTILLLDRSPSMQQGGGQAVGSKLETGRRQLAQAFQMLGSSHWVLIESATNQPLELESPEALLNLAAAEPASASADLPAMLQAAYDYIQANRCGRTEIWICSDLRENDWNAPSGRWPTLRDAFLEMPQGVRFHLLAYSQPSPENVAIRVTDVRRRAVGDGAELLISLMLRREGLADVRVKIPVEFDLEGARSTVNVEMDGPQHELKDHRIRLERGRERGWGRVSIPADANPADNDFFFAFDQPVVRRTIIVADDAQAARPLQLAAGTPPEPALRCTAEVLTREQLATVVWDQVAMLLWQARLPEGDVARAISAFVERGGHVVFFPPRDPGSEQFLDARWLGWIESRPEVAVESWRGDQDVLAHTQSGAALPVGTVQVRRHCGVAGPLTPLATLKGGDPLLARIATNRGGVYCCTTTPAPGDSSLAGNGVVLYVAVQRAAAAGAEVLGATRHAVAGQPPADLPADWSRVAGDREGNATEYPFHRGVYAAGEKLLAVNRAAAEDQAAILPDDRVAELFRGLDFVRVDDQAGSLTALIQEIWRMFLGAMLFALVAEAGLCLPKLARPKGAAR